MTPLDEAGALHTAVLERLLQRVYEAGCHGVYLCGSTGEGLLLRAETRRKIVEIAARNTPAGRWMVVHVGAWSVEESHELARHAERNGAAAISCLRPHGTSFAEMLELYRGLAQATGLPFFAYHFPDQVGGPLTVGQLEQVCSLPGVAGLKFTDYDLFTLSLLVREGKVVFHGRDEMLAAGFLMGASGGIGSTYNLVPEWFVEMWKHARAGRWAEAREVQDRVNDLLRVLLSMPHLAALKRALAWQGFACGGPLAPRLALTAEQECALITALDGMGSLQRS